MVKTKVLTPEDVERMQVGVLGQIDPDEPFDHYDEQGRRLAQEQGVVNPVYAIKLCLLSCDGWYPAAFEIHEGNWGGCIQQMLISGARPRLFVLDGDECELPEYA